MVQLDLHSLKFNMEPENGALKEEIPFRKPSFQVPCLFSGVYMLLGSLVEPKTVQKRIFRQCICVER